MYAANRLGVGVSPINPQATILETAYRINLLGAKIFIGYNLTQENITFLKKECTTLKEIVNISVDNRKILWNPKTPEQKQEDEKTWSYDRFVQMSRYQIGKIITCNDGDAIAFYLITSGTTGKPKIPITRNNEIIAASFSMGAGTGIPIKNNGKSMILVSFDHSYGTIMAIMSTMARKNILLTTEINNQNLAEYIKRKPTATFWAPHLYHMLCRNKEVSEMDLSFFEMLVSGGTPYAVGAKEETYNFVKERGADVFPSDGSGAGELAATLSASVGQPLKSDTVGRVLPGIGVVIIDPVTGEVLKNGEKGLIIVFGDNVSRGGYFGDSKSTEELFYTDEYGNRGFNTNTFGSLDEEHYLKMYGKKERDFQTLWDGVFQKCDNVVIEEFVFELKDIVDQCAVVSREDSERINVPVLFVVLKEGINESEELKEQLLLMCSQEIMIERDDQIVRKQLRPYEVPNDVIFLKKMPVTSLFKTDYKKLEEMATQRQAQRVHTKKS